MKSTRVRAIVVGVAVLALALTAAGIAIGASDVTVTTAAIPPLGDPVPNGLRITVESTGNAGALHGNGSPFTSPIDSSGTFEWFNKPVRIDDFALEDRGSGVPTFTVAAYARNSGGGYGALTALSYPYELEDNGVYSIVATGTDSIGDVAGTVAPAFGVDQIDPVVTNNMLEFYSGLVTVTVSATDTVSGIQNVLVTTGDLLEERNVSWEPSYADPSNFSIDLPFFGEGAHTVLWTAFDNAGNAVSGMQTFTIDNLPPTTTSTADGAVFNGPAVIQLTATDNPDPGGSGVAHTYSRLTVGGFTGPTLEGTTVNVDAPASGLTTPTLEFWSVDNVGNIEATQTADFTVKSQHAITAVAPSGGSITPAGSTLVNYGASQTYSITPATGYHVVNVYVDSVAVGAVSSYTFPNVNAIHTIAAAFAINTYTITPQKSNSHGSISPSSRQTVNYGGSKKFTFKPKGGYKVSKVLVNGRNVGKKTSYTVSNVKQNTTIKVYFVHK